MLPFAVLKMEWPLALPPLIPQRFVFLSPSGQRQTLLVVLTRTECTEA